jgi:peptide/nickel transport system substrate-binding protein
LNDNDTTPDELFDRSSEMNRSEFFKRATAVELALVAALGPTGVANAAMRAARRHVAAPRKGGTLHVGVIGNGPSETYNPAVFNSPIDFLHGLSTYDPLTRFGPNFDFQPGLALRWSSNAAATVWEIHLRQGVHWHDGKPFTADDVIYSLRQMGSTSHFGHFAVASVDLKNLSKRGKYVVHMPMTRPQARISDLFSFVNTLIVQNGAKDFSKPVGTGPFKLQSFTPGQQSVAVRNADYWDSPRPYVDTLQITSISDPTTGPDTLQSGQFDAVYPIIFPLAKAKQQSPSSSNWKLLVQKGGFHQVIYMRGDVAPFKDTRVRLAMKLIPDRKKMIDTVLAGFGEPGNDLFGKHLAYYASHLPQHDQDIEQARSLLKSAGQSGLHVTLQTTDALPGLTDAATFYAQEAAKVGVKVDVKTVPGSSYFNPSLLFLKMPFAQDSWPIVSLAHAYNLLGTSKAPVNEGHYYDSTFDDLASKAQSTLAPGQAQSLWAQAQKRFYDDSSYIVWGLRHSASGVGSKVQGAESGWIYPLGDMKVWNWWLSS